VARYVRLKRELVEFVQHRFTTVIVEKAQGLSPDGIISEAEIAQATEAVLHKGSEAIDAFLAAHPGLRGPDRALVRSWREGVTGLFRPKGRDGRLLELHNLVDDLDYHTVVSSDDPRAWQQLGETSCFISHLVPLGALWTLSGTQHTLDLPDPRLADGLAAEMAQDSPALFFRNPEHLARGWEAMRKHHEAFLARFGNSWVVGPPGEIDRLHREMLADKLRERAADGVVEGIAPELRNAAKANQDRLERFELPASLMEAETLGMLSHPLEGLMFCPDFARFLAAFEDPELGRDPEHREVVLGYLESDTIPPAVIEMTAGLDPGRAGALLAIVLEQPTFDWNRDAEALLRRFKPGCFERPPLPSIVPLPHRMAEGLLALQQRASRAP